MSQAPQLNAIENAIAPDTQKKLQLFNIQEQTQFFFESKKNPKIFLFYLFLVNLHLHKESQKIFFNLQEATYKYDCSEKTILLWLKELESLQLIKYNFRKKQLLFVQVLDYRESKIFDIQSSTATDTQPRTNTKANISHYPNRFFKDMQSIIRKIAKESNKESRVFVLNDELWILKDSKSKGCLEHRDIMLEFQNLNVSNTSISVPYWFIAQTINTTPPPITNPFHQNIFTSHIKQALAKLQHKGEPHEQVA